MLTTTRSVIAALGGSEEVQRTFRCTRDNVNSWNRQRKFPANYYVEMIEALAELRGETARASLWKQRHFRSRGRNRDATSRKVVEYGGEQLVG